MRKSLGALVAVTVLFGLFGFVQAVQAGFCGAVVCLPCAPRNANFVDHCVTVMRTAKKVVYEKQQFTCYKTVYEKVPVARKVVSCRYIPEVRTKQVHYTVCRPVWETKQKVVTYKVSKPVWETRTKQVPYTV